MEEKDKPRLSRLTAIITQLQSKRIVTATYLAEKHNVSVRTIYRDIRTLEKSGIPILAEEANALITVEQLVVKNKDLSLSENVSSAIEKIKAILRYSQEEEVSPAK